MTLDQTAVAPESNGKDKANGVADIAPNGTSTNDATAAAESEKQALRKAAKNAKKKAKEDASNKKADVPSPTAQAPKENKKLKVKKVDTTEEELLKASSVPFGAKKDMSGPMASEYKPELVELAWNDWWCEQGFFQPSKVTDPKKVYVIPIPPPNVTGSLHLGHALTNAIQDCLIRWHRMRGYSTLWNPGCDHAGIATQVVVEKKLWREKKITRHHLGREAFIKEVWVWKEQYGNQIYNQLKKLGSSCDWTRACFTMDPKLSEAVKEAFVTLHEEGIIYRANRLVNWCCQLNTAISDLEVDWREFQDKEFISVPGHDPTKKYEFGTIKSFAYPIENSEEKLIVATTRLETMLGDTAIAVHPDDERYKRLVGKFAVHPFNQRRIPIIADEAVEKDFGTGAVKITPAHDPNDYKMGKAHNLEFITVINTDGLMNENAKPFNNIPRFDARLQIQKALEEKGLFGETKKNPMKIPFCSRSGDVIEPLLKPQWWVKSKSLADDAIKAVTSGQLRIMPVQSRNEWFRWLENIQDWCISRQLWWGHQIPAYLITFKNSSDIANLPKDEIWISAKDENDARNKAIKKFPQVKPENIVLEQDPDVLDTWFSSALWPFSIFGWPNKTEDLANFYPNSLLETGWDILFFWVARMVMMGIKLTGKVPFSEVFCHAMVRDSQGRKMSKSLGNVIDPIDVIHGLSLQDMHKQLESRNLDPKELKRAMDGQKKDYPRGIPKCGADALRFTLCAYTHSGRDINLDILRVEGYRKFCNKLWNAVRFGLMKLDQDFKPQDISSQRFSSKSLVERWILHQLNQATKEVNTALHEKNFMSATSAIYRFWLYDVCDIYIESIKPILEGGSAEEKQSFQQTLYICLDRGLRLLHPFMPFVTEELWQRLPGILKMSSVESIMLSAYPETMEAMNDEKALEEFEYLNNISKAARSLISVYNVSKKAQEEKKPIQIYIMSLNLEKVVFIKEHLSTLKTLLFVKNLEITFVEKNNVPAGCAVEPVDETCTVYLLVKGVVNIEEEIEKLMKRLSISKTEHDELIKKTSGQDYEKKVKDSVKLADNQKIKVCETEQLSLQKSIDTFKQLLE